MSNCREITPEMTDRIKNRLKTCTVLNVAKFYNVSEGEVRKIFRKLNKKVNKKFEKIKPQRVERPSESAVKTYDFSKLNDEDKRKYEACKASSKVSCYNNW